MKSGGRVALGVGAGYLLGRTRKMRLALMIAAAGVTGTVSPRELVQRGLKQLATSPELGKLAETARGELLGAVKSAAVTAASSRIDSLNERLQSPAGAVTEKATGGKQKEDEAGEPEESGDEEARAEPEEESEEPEDEEPKEETRQPRRTATRGRTSARTPTQRRSSPEESGDGAPAHRTRARASTSRTPVRRRGR